MRASSVNTDIYKPHLNSSPYKGEADIVAGARIERASQGYAYHYSFRSSAIRQLAEADLWSGLYHLLSKNKLKIKELAI